MYLMQTVSAVPRPRTAAHMETKQSYINPVHGEYPKYKGHSLENGMLNHARIIYELGANNENETESSRKQQQSEINRRNTNNHSAFEDIQVENEEEKEKKKEKKWTLGGFFRRKCKKDGDDSSEDSGEDNKKGFLSRHKSKRERRKLKARSMANGFDVVIPQQNVKNGEITAEQLWSGDGKTQAKTTEPGTNNGPVRYIHRHHPGAEVKTNKDSLQVPKHSRRDSNLSRSSGGSENTEGRKGRKEVLARAEAKRDMMRDDSSSDENDSYHSNSSLNRLNGDPSRRPRRTDRHKRLSRDEENLMIQKENELRMIKSDFEGGRRLPANCRWISRTYYPDSSDHEAVKLNLMNHSGTPSPCRSPRARQKQLLHYMSLMQSAYPTSTFPPGVHYQPPRNATSNPVLTPNRNQVYAKENQLHGSQPFVNCRNQIYKGNRSSEYNLPRSLSTDNPNRKTLMEYEQFLSSCGMGKENGLPYDQNIHRASYFENEPGSPLLPAKMNYQNCPMNGRRQNRSEMFTNDGRRDDIYNYNIPQHAVKRNENGVVENRTDSTPSLSIQPGSFPHQPTQIVQRSASGNSFCNLQESSRNFYPNRSNSYQHIPTNLSQPRYYPKSQQNGKPNGIHYWSQDETPQPKSPESTKENMYSNIPPFPNPPVDSIPAKSHLNGSPSILRYYADQNPRSRNPIHITCNPTTNGIVEQPYLSDSQMMVKPPQSAKNSASDFWRLKDQEIMKNFQKSDNALKPPATQNSAKSDRSRSNSPRLKDVTKGSGIFKSQERGVNGNANESDRCNSENKPVDNNNRKILKEEYNVAKVNKTPPEPPVRRLSKQEVLARLHKCEQIKNQENQNKRNETKISNSNLDEALNELEIIYNSLRLKDEDLVDRAERRDLPVFRPKNPINSVSVRDKIQNFYAETDFSHSPGSKNPSESNGHQRAIPLRRSGIPDKTTDDMAFRRMNPKDRVDVKKFPSQSYLRSSPALSPVPGGSPTFRKESPVLEPDVTYDDVVFRNIRHANSTLKIQDPQPPFGIPIGVITPAPNSDYLHAMPKERFRPTFTSSKTPDVVKDDLAFRNLRKDNKTNTCLVVDPNKNDSSCLMKKRAVRSLSANLYNIMQKDNPEFSHVETNNNVIFDKGCDKTRSLTDLSNSKTEKQVLEKRLKELKEEKNAKRAEFFELSQESRKKANEKGMENLSWTDLANLNGNFENLPETSLQKKLQVNFSSDDLSRTPPEKKSFRSPVVELSKYPAAAPSSSLQGNPFKEPSLVSPVDEDQLESLLSALAMEAKNASKDLERQLDQLETKKTSKLVNDVEPAAKEKSKARAIEEFNKKFKTNSLDKSKRRRNLSLSSAHESKEEVRKTGSLERRKVRKSDKNGFPFEEVLRKGTKTNETKSDGLRPRADHSPSRQPPADVIETRAVAGQSPLKNERKLSKSDSGSSLERKRSQTFEVITDLSQILHDVEVEQHLNNEVAEKNAPKVENCDVFQEVYEYNCRLVHEDRRRSRGSQELGRAEVETVQVKAVLVPENREPEDPASDIEKEFEKLHEEVNSSTKETKETQNESVEFTLVDDLLADIASVDPSPSDSYSSFPFPNEECGTPSSSSERMRKGRNGTSPGSSKGEGLGHA